MMYNLSLGELTREQILSQMVEIQLNRDDYFLVVRETLTRIGIASTIGKKLFQSCHIFQKKGRFYIVHFKEMLAMDGLNVTMTLDDLNRRNAIALQLLDWNLITIKTMGINTRENDDSRLTVVPFNEKRDWELVPKYSMGKKIKKGE